jgi:hypothetical protein
MQEIAARPAPEVRQRGLRIVIRYGSRQRRRAQLRRSQCGNQQHLSQPAPDAEFLQKLGDDDRTSHDPWKQTSRPPLPPQVRRQPPTIEVTGLLVLCELLDKRHTSRRCDQRNRFCNRLVVVQHGGDLFGGQDVVERSAEVNNLLHSRREPPLPSFWKQATPHQAQSKLLRYVSCQRAALPSNNDDFDPGARQGEGEGSKAAAGSTASGERLPTDQDDFRHVKLRAAVASGTARRVEPILVSEARSHRSLGPPARRP